MPCTEALKLKKMPFSQISVSETINRAIKKALASDPANKDFIATLHGLRIKIDCTQPNTVFFVQFKDGNVEIHKPVPEEDENADLHLQGTAINLLRLAASPIDNAAGLRGSNININGDVGLLLELSQAIKMIDIDWELLLAEQIGETPAVLMSRTLSAGWHEARKIQSDLAGKLTQKMQSENSPLPNKNSLAGLKARLRDLNYRLDRLEAKTSTITDK